MIEAAPYATRVRRERRESIERREIAGVREILPYSGCLRHKVIVDDSICAGSVANQARHAQYDVKERASEQAIVTGVGRG